MLHRQHPTIAPAGESLFQLDMPVAAGEPKADARARLERLADLAVPGWRDRPAINRGDGVFLAGDMVAAPGMRGEISLNSAVRAAQGALTAAGLSTPVG